MHKLCKQNNELNMAKNLSKDEGWIIFLGQLEFLSIEEIVPTVRHKFYELKSDLDTSGSDSITR